MRRKEQYVQMQELKREIDDKLRNRDFEVLKSMLRELSENVVYNKVRNSDTQLGMFDTFLLIWLQEKAVRIKKANTLDIFDRVYSLEDLEEKYLKIEFPLLRLEAEMPEEYCREGIETILQLEASGIALYHILAREAVDILPTLRRLTYYLKTYEQYEIIVELLAEAVEHKIEDEVLVLELVGAYFHLGDFVQALTLLKGLSNPSDRLRAIADELEKKVGHDGSEGE